MVLLKDIKGNEYKVNETKKKIEKYQKLPGIYVTVKEILRDTRREEKISWNKQKTQ